MSYGLQCYNDTGQITLSLTSRLFRYVGTVFVSAFPPASPQTVSWPGMSNDGTWAVISVEGTAKAIISTDEFTLYAVSDYMADSDYIILRF